MAGKNLAKVKDQDANQVVEVFEISLKKTVTVKEWSKSLELHPSDMNKVTGPTALAMWWPFGSGPYLSGTISIDMVTARELLNNWKLAEHISARLVRKTNYVSMFFSFSTNFIS